MVSPVILGHKEVQNPLHRENLDIDKVKKAVEVSEMSYLCGRESVMVSLLVLVIGGLHMFTFSSYFGGFVGMVVVFFLLGMLSFLLLGFFAVARVLLCLHRRRRKKKTKLMTPVSAHH